MAATLEELLERLAEVNARPCDEGDLHKSISQIISVIGDVINNGGGGSIVAKCLLSPPGPDCVSGTLDVSDFVPFWDTVKFGAFPYPTPTDAINDVNYAVVGSKVGYIGLNHSANQWEVIASEEAFFNWVTDIEQTSNKGFSGTIQSGTAHSCETTGTVEFLITTVVARVLQEIVKDGCAINGLLTDVEVFDNDIVATPELMVLFDDVVHLLGDVVVSGCVVYGYYVPVTVPCSGTPYVEALFYAEDICECCDESGSVSEGDCDCPPCVLIEWDIDDDGTGSPIGDPFTASGSVTLNTDAGDCDYIMTTVGGASPAEGASAQLSPSLCFSPGSMRVVISNTSATGPVGTVPYVNDSSFPFDDPMPVSDAFPYDSGVVTLYRHSDPDQPVGTVRVRTLAAGECGGAIE